MSKKIRVPNPNGDGEIEITLPDGYVLRAEVENEIRQSVQASVDADFARRSTSVTKNALKAALQDDAFKGEALQTWGIDLEKIGKPSADVQEQIREAVDRAGKEFRRTQLDPLQGKLEGLTKDLTSTRRRVLARDIVSQAREAGVHEYLLKAIGGGEPAIVGMIESQFGFDGDTGNWYRKAGESFAVSTKPTQERLYQDVGEYFTQLQGDKEFAAIFRDQRQKGPGVGDVTSQRERVPTISNDPLLFGQNAEKIAKGEITVSG
jgi:hypothetical protein